VFHKNFLLHKVVRDAKKVEKHCTSAVLVQMHFYTGQWLQNRPWIFQFETYSTISCKVAVTHEENAAGFVET